MWFPERTQLALSLGIGGATLQFLGMIQGFSDSRITFPKMLNEIFCAEPFVPFGCDLVGINLVPARARQFLGKVAEPLVHPSRVSQGTTDRRRGLREFPAELIDRKSGQALLGYLDGMLFGPRNLFGHLEDRVIDPLVGQFDRCPKYAIHARRRVRFDGVRDAPPRLSPRADMKFISSLGATFQAPNFGMVACENLNEAFEKAKAIRSLAL